MNVCAELQKPSKILLLEWEGVALYICRFFLFFVCVCVCVCVWGGKSDRTVDVHRVQARAKML